ncbi:MAG: hypothetical protein PQJ58_15405 [Spirochaetales bacterium]|nr:hypothetical protein [Spirochaetales bacterium]
MYTGRGFESSELGDVDIIRHNGLFHLFHLVLPNHDYIAHAVSNDGFLWRRVKNALFIGEPGDWDDDMLWTMHVSPDPDGPALFRMFYTGISRKEGGRIQRIGLARSNDLYYWEKVSSTNYPVSITGPFYEESVAEGRHWVSCRDPFFFQDGDKRGMLVNARVPFGPKIRRGCVGLAFETEPDLFQWEKPLFFPGMYDDIEVPGLYRINNNYYLVGNVKEDVKIHYWHCDKFEGPYEAFADNVLLPKGNYAARITKIEDTYLLWNFFTNRDVESRTTILPPPTELQVDKEGQLYLRSYAEFSRKIQKQHSQKDLIPFTRQLKNHTGKFESKQDSILLESLSGYEIYFMKKQANNFHLSCSLSMEGTGKCGIVFRAGSNTDGHFISLDFINGLAQGRIWGESSEQDIENAFHYKITQSNHFNCTREQWKKVDVIAYGGYIELSIDERIVLRYVETEYMNNDFLGFYVESAVVNIAEMTLNELDGPEEEDHQVL